MVQQADTEDLPRLGQPAGDLVILAAGVGVPAGMVVDDEDGGRRFAQRGREDLARVHEALVEAATAHLDLGDQALPAVEQEHVEELLAQLSQTRAEVGVDLLRRLKPLAGIQRRPREPGAELEGGAQ